MRRSHGCAILAFRQHRVTMTGLIPSSPWRVLARHRRLAHPLGELQETVEGVVTRL